MTNSKQKGNTYERWVAAQMSERFTEYLGVPQGFRRNGDSGAYFGGSNAGRTKTHDLDFATFGDLICPRNFNWVVECKFYKSPPSMAQIIKGKIPQWDGWIEQCREDAHKAHKSPLLVVRYNRTPDMVITSHGSLISIPCIMRYGSRSIYSFEDFLSLPNDVFFSDKPETGDDK
jgi:hypothetical protein